LAGATTAGARVIGWLQPGRRPAALAIAGLAASMSKEWGSRLPDAWILVLLCWDGVMDSLLLGLRDMLALHPSPKIVFQTRYRRTPAATTTLA